MTDGPRHREKTLQWNGIKRSSDGDRQGKCTHARTQLEKKKKKADARRISIHVKHTTSLFLTNTLLHSSKFSFLYNYHVLFLISFPSPFPFLAPLCTLLLLPLQFISHHSHILSFSISSFPCPTRTPSSNRRRLQRPLQARDTVMENQHHVLYFCQLQLHSPVGCPSLPPPPTAASAPSLDAAGGVGIRCAGSSHV